MKEKMWYQDLNWIRLTLVFTILPGILNFVGMIWSIIDGNWESGFILSAMVGVCTTCSVLIWKNTRR